MATNNWKWFMWYTCPMLCALVAVFSDKWLGVADITKAYLLLLMLVYSCVNVLLLQLSQPASTRGIANEDLQHGGYY